MEPKISVVLVDDHALVRRGFRRLLEDAPDIHVAGEANNGAEAVRLARELRPQVIVMDCALPGVNGLVATTQILEMLPNTFVLMLSMHSEDTWVRKALEAGARGYILKNAMDLNLVSAVRRVAAGGRWAKKSGFSRTRQRRWRRAGSASAPWSWACARGRGDSKSGD